MSHLVLQVADTRTLNAYRDHAYAVPDDELLVFRILLEVQTAKSLLRLLIHLYGCRACSGQWSGHPTLPTAGGEGGQQTATTTSH
jgi:hypothetical protein